MCDRVKECQILLLNGLTKGCFLPPPYLDDYGETDQGLKYVLSLAVNIVNDNTNQRAAMKINNSKIIYRRIFTTGCTCLSHLSLIDDVKVEGMWPIHIPSTFHIKSL